MTKLITVDQIDEVFNPSKKQLFEFQQSIIAPNRICCPINFSYLYNTLQKQAKSKYMGYEHFIVIFSSMKEVFAQLAKLGTCEVYISYRAGEDLSKFITNPILRPTMLNRKLSYLVKLILG